MTILHLDLETFSACELKERGLHNYASDPTTGIHCAAYAFDDGPIELWTPDSAPLEHHQLFDHIREGGLVYAHNAVFEIQVWNNVGASKYQFPKLKIEQMRCTMAMCYAMALPGALANAAPALGIEQRKDQAGARVMMQLAKPKGRDISHGCLCSGDGIIRFNDGKTQRCECIQFWKPSDDPAKFEQLYAYCRQDVEVERAIHGRLMELSDYEQNLWCLDYKVNERGVQVDVAAIDKAIGLVQAEQKRLNAEMLKTTAGVVGACTEVQLLVKWIRSQGVELKGLAKADVLDALSGELPRNVAAALRLRKEAAKSSTAKLIAMKERASADGRVRGIHQYHGASTGRWAGRGIQTQNYPRPRRGMKPKHIEDVIASIMRTADKSNLSATQIERDYIDMMYGPVLDAVADSLRGMIAAPPGREYISVDFSNIEGRVLAWLAGEEWKLQAFRDFDAGIGPDIYKLTYSTSFNVPLESVDDDDRQIGKVQELFCGFGGGVGAGQKMARAYGVVASDAEIDEWKKAWRAKHQNVVRYWYALEDAAKAAVTQGGAWTVGNNELPPVTFKKAGSFLWCKLPSGRVLCYPYPKIAERETPWGEMKEGVHFMSVNGVTNKWEETSTYGGSLAENVTQAVARDLLAHSMFTLEKAGYKISMHIHDQAVAEITTQADNGTLKRVEDLFAQSPTWAAGLPIAAEGWRGPRFRK